MLKILVLEDEERVSVLIKRSLEEQGYFVDSAYDGKVARQMALEREYDLLIADVIVPEITGIEFCRQLKQTKPNVPVLLLTGLCTTDNKVDGFNAGADDYMVKPFDLRELHVRIRALIRRINPASAVMGFILKYADLEMNLQTKDVTRNGVHINLTPKEFCLLEYMMRNSERLLTRTEIAEKVWNTYFDTCTNFIDVYMNYLRKKVDKDFSSKLIRTRPGMGFIFMKEK